MTILILSFFLLVTETFGFQLVTWHATELNSKPPLQPVVAMCPNTGEWYMSVLGLPLRTNTLSSVFVCPLSLVSNCQ